MCMHALKLSLPFCMAILASYAIRTQNISNILVASCIYPVSGFFDEFQLTVSGLLSCIQEMGYTYVLCIRDERKKYTYLWLHRRRKENGSHSSFPRNFDLLCVWNHFLTAANLARMTLESRHSYVLAVLHDFFFFQIFQW